MLGKELPGETHEFLRNQTHPRLGLGAALGKRVRSGRQRLEQAAAIQRRLDQTSLQLGLGTEAHVLQREFAQTRQALDRAHLILQVEREQAGEAALVHARGLFRRVVRSQ